MLFKIGVLKNFADFTGRASRVSWIWSLIGIVSMLIIDLNSARKGSKYGVFSGPYFPVFGLNTEIYSVNLCIQFKYRKIWARNNSVFGHFSCSVIFDDY